jgi:uncharacterized protein (TIGR02996 family)
MFTEADALLAAIFERPDDDTPRLAYADWLDENGQETYARFIRVQCTAARFRPGDPKSEYLRRWIYQLWRTLEEEWSPACREVWPHTDYVSWGFTEQLTSGQFSRGMPDVELGTTFDQLVRYERCWPWLPAPRCVLVPGDEHSVPATRIGELPRLARLRHVTLEALNFDDGADWFTEQVTRFLASPHLNQLVTLKMRYMDFRACYVPVLLDSPNLASVQEVRVEVGKDSDCSAEWVKRRLDERFRSVVFT